MNQVVASYRSVEAEFTSVQASRQRQSLAVQIGGSERPKLLNTQQNDIIDDVDISTEAVQKLQDAQVLAQQLQEYLDYLQGRNKGEVPRITVPNKDSDVVIAGSSTKLSASITAGKITEKTFDVSATFDDDGKLSELSVTKTQTTVEFVRAEISLEDRQFYASF